jgi:hypothetical protein
MPAPVRLTALLLLLALAPLAGCGEEEPRAAPEPPELTLPRTDTEPEAPPAPTQTAPPAPAEPQAPQTDYENAPSPHPPPRDQDGPGNDTPPPPGSPAERFEQECEQNPEACG